MAEFYSDSHPKDPPVIEVEVKNVYGNLLIYPVNDHARTLAHIAGTKTLSTLDLENAIKLGLHVEEVNPNKLAINS